MRLQTVGWLGGLATLAVGMAVAQTATKPLIHHTFEDSEEGWAALGGSGKVALVHEAADVKEGKGALQFQYEIKKGDLSLLALPTSDGSLTKMKSLSFWIKSNYAAPLVVALNEKGGGRYNALFMAPKDTWQKVELAPSDFTLGTGKDDPKDPDNKLDLDQVDNVAIVDLNQILVQGDENVVKLFNVPTGAHTLTLDDFAVSDTALAEATETVNGETKLDGFARPQLAWLTIGDSRLSRSTGKPLEGSGLQVDFQQAPGKLMVLAKSVPTGKLAGKDHVSFSLASAKPLTLIVQLEETSGGKYNATIDVPGDKERKEFHLAFTDFKEADDSQDNNRQLDLDQVHQINFVDPNAFTGAANQDNTLWINNLRVGGK